MLQEGATAFGTGGEMKLAALVLVKYVCIAKTLKLSSVVATGRYQHPNIVSLIGFSTPPISAIVYEYVPGGSLFDRLHKVTHILKYLCGSF